MRSSARFPYARVLVPALFLAGCPAPSPTMGALKVTVVQGEAGDPAQAATVRLVGKPIAASTNVGGVADLTNLVPGPYTVRVGLIGFCQTDRDVVVTAGVVTDVFIWLCSDIVAPTNPVADRLLALLDLRIETATGSECENDRLVVGKRTAAVGGNALALAGCRGAAWILSPDQAPAFSNVAADFPWTAGAGDSYAPTLPAQRLRVPVTIWISDRDMDAAARTALRAKLTDALLPKANDLFRENLSGIQLVADEAAEALPEIIDVVTVVDPVTGDHPFAQIGSNCDFVASIRATPVIYKPERFNLYYLNNILDGSAKGYNCVAQGAPNIIFIDADGADYFTLPHELGHGLGLTLPDWGHSEQVPGFWNDASGALSIMGRGATAATYFSVGQVVRMQVEPSSWLNVSVGGSSIRSRQTTAPLVTPCGCPESESTDDCPKLRTDIVRTGTQVASAPFPMACYVKAPPCLSVLPGSSTSFDAKFYTSPAATTTGYGEASVVSFTPLMKATLQSESPGQATAEVSVAGPGTGEVRMYGGGAFASVVIRVGSACP